MYKLISKILANKLKRVLAVMIDDSQSAFVLGRLITDNVFVAFETMHYIDQRKKGKEVLMAIKLNMSKANDRVEWVYLEAMMRKMGFHEKWISLIMMCVSTVSYSMLINGEPKGRIIPLRGLRQGDPISPYLFLLCAEGLLAMLKKEERERYIKGIAVSRGAPSISHLLFADDSIVFYRATIEECNGVFKVLQDYEADLGQKLNKEKTSLYFSKNTSREIKDYVKEKFGARVVHHHEKYLGLPPLMGKGKRKAFNRIKDQVGRKIARWKGKLLSHVGREILIKAVAQATPTYTMSYFIIPDTLRKELNSMMSNFWWGQKDKERKKASISWEKLCTPKAEGGMGFRDLKAFNLALLAKQGWRIQQNPSSLFHRVLKAKYFPNDLVKEAELGQRPSYMWRSILAARQVIEERPRWCIGNGESIHIWKDRWIPTSESFRVISPVGVHSGLEKVPSLLDIDRRAWDVVKVRNTLPSHEAKVVKSIPISISLPEDSIIWAWTPNGRFTVKSTYKVAQKVLKEGLRGVERGGNSDNLGMKAIWRILWRLSCPNKNKHLL